MREKIEAHHVYTFDKITDWVCDVSEVRQLESDYAKLEARLGEAVKNMKNVMRAWKSVCSCFEWDEHHLIEYENAEAFLVTLDQEKEKSDEV